MRILPISSGEAVLHVPLLQSNVDRHVWSDHAHITVVVRIMVFSHDIGVDEVSGVCRGRLVESSANGKPVVP